MGYFYERRKVSVEIASKPQFHGLLLFHRWIFLDQSRLVMQEYEFY